MDHTERELNNINQVTIAASPQNLSFLQNVKTAES